jgi:AcrR family transcriptional regulator
VPDAIGEPSRRDRVRAATLAEIKETARRLLVAQGVEGVSLRAIAREMGMTAPALYRYYANHEELQLAITDDLFGELVAAMVAARDAEPDADIIVKGAGVIRAFRRWAVEHRPEFAMIFARPMSPAGCEPMTPNGDLFAVTWDALFAQVWRERPFPIKSDDEIEPRLAEQLRGYVESSGWQPPLGALLVHLDIWTRVYGLVALEVFGHLQWAVVDVEPLFEATIADVVGSLWR